MSFVEDDDPYNKIDYDGAAPKAGAKVPQHTFRSEDMAMAAWLVINGHSVQLIDFEPGAYDDSTCYWYFEKTPTLLQQVDDFQAGRAMVEPREFNKTFANLKKSMFAVKDQARGQR